MTGKPEPATAFANGPAASARWWETSETRTEWAVRYEYGDDHHVLARRDSEDEALRDAAKHLLGPRSMTAVSRVVQHRESAWTAIPPDGTRGIS